MFSTAVANQIELRSGHELINGLADGRIMMLILPLPSANIRWKCLAHFELMKAVSEEG